MPVEELIAEYSARTRRSGECHQQLRQLLPDGVTRTIAHFAPYPIVLVEGHGAVVRDLDGNEYLDVLNNYTSLVHGHAFAPIVEASRAALDLGSVFPAPHPAQLELAAHIGDRYPAAEQLRFTNSGSEATMLALRLARAATGRRIVLLFDGGYHGTIGEFMEGGPEVHRIPYNDVDTVRQTVDGTVAAVFVEPFLGSGGVIPGEPGFLRQTQEIAQGAGALFVLDEIQALRNAPHGTHALLGLDPDLVLMGKIIGGGLPIGAVCGRSSLLATLAAGRLPHSGTFNGNVVSMIAGLVALRTLDETAIAALNRSAETLAEQITLAGRAADLPVSVTRAGSIMHVHVDEPAVPALHLALLMEGIYAAPRGMLNLSTALDDGQLARVGLAYASAFQRVAAAVGRPAGS